MKIWRIWCSELPVIYIETNSFDKALEKARNINPNYNTVQIQDKVLTNTYKGVIL